MSFMEAEVSKIERTTIKIKWRLCTYILIHNLNLLFLFLHISWGINHDCGMNIELYTEKTVEVRKRIGAKDNSWSFDFTQLDELCCHLQKWEVLSEKPVISKGWENQMLVWDMLIFGSLLQISYMLLDI